jgi:ABC-2 type transport system ATP-binding protein
VLFSSHITSDLDRSADRLLFLLGGRLAFDGELDRYLEAHARVRLAPGELSAEDRSRLFALRETGTVVEGLSRDPAYWRGRHGAVVERAELEDIIVGSSLEARK